jgi:hypothetical protein
VRVDNSLERLLDAQLGVVTTCQARAHLTRRQLEAEIAFGTLHRLWPGIYSRPRPDILVKLRGLDLSAAVPVVACLNTAAALHGFDTEQVDDVHVLNPSHHQLRSVAGLMVHRRRGAPLTVVGDRPVTEAAWTAIEVARCVKRPRALAALDAALRTAACDRAALRRAAKRQAGRRGIVATREMVELADSAAESPMESEARLAMIDGGLPAPTLQYEIVDADGRLWRLDFAWPYAKVAAEYESEAWHNSPDALRRDRTRYAALQELGWTVIPLVTEDVRSRPVEMCRRIGTQLDGLRAA